MHKKDTRKGKIGQKRRRLKIQDMSNFRILGLIICLCIILSVVFSIRHAEGLELKRATGGVSFLYDEPPQFEKYHDQREQVILHLHTQS